MIRQNMLGNRQEQVVVKESIIKDPDLRLKHPPKRRNVGLGEYICKDVDRFFLVYSVFKRAGGPAQLTYIALSRNTVDFKTP